MTDLDVFLPYIMPKALGCNEPAAFQAIRLAAIEFCERTRLWRDSDSFAVAPGSCKVVCAPEGAQLFEIESARFDEQQLDPVAIQYLDREVPGWRTKDEGQPKWLTQVERGSVQLVPQGTGTLYLQTILRPTDEAEQLPDFLATDFRIDIANGALGHILLLPGQTFTDASAAAVYAGKFQARLDSLFNRSIKGQQRAPARAKARFL